MYMWRESRFQQHCYDAPAVFTELPADILLVTFPCSIGNTVCVFVCVSAVHTTNNSIKFTHNLVSRGMDRGGERRQRKNGQFLIVQETCNDLLTVQSFIFLYCIFISCEN